MASRALTRYPRTSNLRFKEVKQYFNYLLVMDLEATCMKHEMLVPQEIIELPCMVVSTQDWQVKNIFHEYVKPRVHPELTTFCTELTGIIQDMVESQPHFPEIYHKFSEWLEEHRYFQDENKSAFVTCGNWDLSVMFPDQCALDRITPSEHYKQWINLKNTFCESTNYYPRSLKDMLARLNVPLKGHLHSGINDVENMVTVIQNLRFQHNTLFKITSKLDTSKKPSMNLPLNHNRKSNLLKNDVMIDKTAIT